MTLGIDYELASIVSQVYLSPSSLLSSLELSNAKVYAP